MKSQKGAWNKLRFDWKKQANQSRNLSRSGKQMASHICDFCVNKDTGQFFHGNDVLADALGVNERSIQRYLNELVHLVWLRRVRVRGQRRTFQLTFPGGLPAREHDNSPKKFATNLTFKHDKSDAPITNQVINHSGSQRSAAVSVVLVAEKEQVSLNEWRAWLSENTDLGGDKVFQLLRKPGGYHFPARYPSEDEHKRALYLQYFEAVVNRSC